MKWFVPLALAACFAAPARLCAGEIPPTQALAAAEIMEKNAAARGGLEAWQKIQTMVWVGHIESAHAPAPGMAFALEMKRPNMSRFEIKAQNQKSVRIFDGTRGWKLRPANNGKPELQPYTTDESRFARDMPRIDWPLMDYQAQGAKLMLEGVDDIEGRQAYRMNARLPAGTSRHVWIDAQTFLDIAYDREAISTSGQPVVVQVSYRNYRAIDGLQIAHLIETGAGTGQVPDKMTIEKVLLNPPLDDQVFANPNIPRRRNVISVNATAAAVSGEHE